MSQIYWSKSNALFLSTFGVKINVKNKRKRVSRMCENAYLSIKNPKASRALKQALDPGRRMLTSLRRQLSASEAGAPPWPNPGSAPANHWSFHGAKNEGGADFKRIFTDIEPVRNRVLLCWQTTFVTNHCSLITVFSTWIKDSQFSSNPLQE